MAELSTLTRTDSPRVSSRVSSRDSSRDSSPETVRSDFRPTQKREESAPEERRSIRRETAIPGSSSGMRSRAPGHDAKPAKKTASRQTVRILTSQDQKVAARVVPSPAAARRHTGYGLRIFAAFILLAGLGAIGYFGLPEATRITKVKVDGMKSVSEADVIPALALTADVNLINADLAAMESRVAADPRIASVRIRRVLPDGLSVELTERSPVAAVLVEEGSVSRQVLVDAEGVAYAYADSSPSQMGIPVLSGIRFENFKPGQRLPDYLSPLLGDIARIGKEKPSLLSAFSEIRIVKLADNEAELLLYPLHRAIPVRMPPALDADKLVSALLLLDILSGRESSDGIEEIDFRTGTVVYRTKEGQPG